MKGNFERHQAKKEREQKQENRDRQRLGQGIFVSKNGHATFPNNLFSNPGASAPQQQKEAI